VAGKYCIMSSFTIFTICTILWKKDDKFQGFWQENLKENTTEDLRIDMRVINVP
jgi:hypothetical protein